MRRGQTLELTLGEIKRGFDKVQIVQSDLSGDYGWFLYKTNTLLYDPSKMESDDDLFITLLHELVHFYDRGQLTENSRYSEPDNSAIIMNYRKNINDYMRKRFLK